MISFEVDEVLFRTYVFYTAILVLKVLAMAPLTAKQRFAKMVFANPEDAKMNPKSKVKYDDADIERVRRAHLNDLENIPLFIIVCFGYLLTIPNVYIAINLIRLFVASRIIHTIVYAVVVLPQPARGLSWFAGFATTVYMAVQVILSFV
ncbi:microsomal glutathione S-transferase 1-like [Acyrthosiphon pisum]|uniref:Microsomal glutathione S-transferase 1 n=1 Tax=Acyrthosiphon pisum TaxID=7029 RepID=C4WTK2_ACYPI|nr:microsomal glutathione S-transferase 1-like [Acyrthosiphon pisum]BAH71222.1 ACYPI004835 [Acyrthosiphon pisum]|eukprot:NP_001156173.1 microsomal glutathione S-transferase 1-like [Acyrthosiphon pisum]